MKNTYEIEIINWQWNVTKTSSRKGGDPYWFSREGNGSPRIKRFATQKAAREWLVRNGFRPLFSVSRPSLYRSPMSGMEARIVVADDPYGFYPAGSFEGRIAKRLSTY